MMRGVTVSGTRNNTRRYVRWGGIVVCLALVLIVVGMAAMPAMAAQRGVSTPLAAGLLHTVAVKSDGTLWAWGFNGTGQLGDGTLVDKTTPTQIGTGNKWASVAAGLLHTVGLKSDGTAWAWGYNDYGQLGDGTTHYSSSPVQISTLNNLVSIAVGSTHSLALKSDGTLWAWGLGDNGELGYGTIGYEISPVQVGTDNTWAVIASGSDHNLALKADGTLWGWGFNGVGSVGNGSLASVLTPTQIGTDNTWASIAAGAYHSLAIKTDGTLWAWGGNWDGALGDGTIVSRTTPTQIGTDHDWASVAGGERFTIALKTDGTLWAWGDNAVGQLGNATVVSRTTPTQIGTDTTWAFIAPSTLHEYTTALKADGTLWAWGYNAAGQLGDGTRINKHAPVQILQSGASNDWGQFTAGVLSVDNLRVTDISATDALSVAALNIPVRVEVVVRNTGDVVARNQVLKLTDLTGGGSASLNVADLGVGNFATYSFNWTFTGSDGCRELEAKLNTDTANLFFPVGQADACDNKAITVTASVSGSNVEGSAMTLSGTAVYEGASPAMGARVLVTLTDGSQQVTSYTASTRSPDGSFSIKVNTDELPSYPPAGQYAVRFKVTDGNKTTGKKDQSLTVTAGSPDLSGTVSFSGLGYYQYGYNTHYAAAENPVVPAVSVKNATSSAATGSIKVRFYLENTAPTPDTLIGESIASINLVNGTSTMVSCPNAWTPAADQTGIRYIKTVIDADNAIAEGNETNNTIRTKIEVRAARPNLYQYNQVSWVGAEPVAGEKATLQTTIYNTGKADLPMTSFDVAFYDGSPMADNSNRIGVTRVTAELPMGARINAVYEWDTTGVLPGNHYIHAVVDAAGEVDEDFETDNIAANTLDIFTVGPNPLFTSAYAYNISVNESGHVTVSIKNRGGAPTASETVRIYRDGVKISESHTGILQRGASMSIDTVWGAGPVAGYRSFTADIVSSGEQIATSAYVYPAPPPDLSVYSSDIAVSGTDTSRTPGSSVSVAALVFNAGSNAGSFMTRFSAQDVDTGTIIDLGVANKTGLAGSASVIVTAPKSLVMTSRNYVVTVQVDQPAEGDISLGNNVATQYIRALGGAPLADAGPDRQAYFGQTVALNNYLAGAGMLHSWTFTSRPAGSSAAISNAGRAQASFMPDRPGVYNVQLQVTNAFKEYAYATVLITVAVGQPSSIMVPTSSTSKNITVQWAPSGTPSATYQAEISDDGGSTWRGLYNGSMTQATTLLPGNGTYEFRVKALRSGFESPWTQQTGVFANIACIAPYQIILPANTGTGTYTVSWYASATTGAEYVLEEKAGSGAWTEVYTGAGLSYNFSNKTNGTYQYRVKATMAGYQDSTWTTGAVGVNLTCSASYQVTVPPTSSSGSYVVSWYASATAGVTYVLEEKVNSGAFAQVYTGTAKSYTFSNKANGTYQYRVKATLAGSVDSTWTTSGIVTVNLACSASYRVTAPATSASGSYLISWYPSATTGATYVLEEKVNNGLWVSAGSGTAASRSFSGKTSGTYQYRVKVTKNGYIDSAWTTSGVVTVP